MQRFAEGTEIPAHQDVAHFVGQLDHALDGAEFIFVRLHRLYLRRQHRARIALTSGEKQENVALELSHLFGAEDDRLYVDAAVGIELDEVQAAMRGRVLILFADRLFQDIDFKLAGLFRQLILGGKARSVGVERVDQRHGKGAGRSESGPGGNVGDGGDFDAGLDPMHAQCFTQQRMRDLFKRVGELGARIFQMVFVFVEVVVHDDEAVLGYRAGQDRSGLPAVIGRDVRAAAGEADPKRCG